MYLRIRIYEIIFNSFFKLSQMQHDYWSESYKKLHIEKKYYTVFILLNGTTPMSTPWEPFSIHKQ